MARERPAPASRAEAADWDARQWLIDNALSDDSVGMPPEITTGSRHARPDADAHHYRDSITETELPPLLVT